MTKYDLEFFIKNGWPCVIAADRYTGTYSGALWIAFAEEEVPYGPLEDDVTAGKFWSERKLPVGKGSTPDEALESLHEEILRLLEDLIARCEDRLAEGGPTGSETEAPAAEVDEVVCRYCGGSGKVWPHTADSQTVKIRCRYCLGTGMEKKYA